jgi:hypothetical protein
VLNRVHFGDLHASDANGGAVTARKTAPLSTDAHAADAWPEHDVLASQPGSNNNGRVS